MIDNIWKLDPLRLTTSVQDILYETRMAQAQDKLTKLERWELLDRELKQLMNLKLKKQIKIEHWMTAAAQ